MMSHSRSLKGLVACLGIAAFSAMTSAVHAGVFTLADVLFDDLSTARGRLSYVENVYSAEIDVFDRGGAFLFHVSEGDNDEELQTNNQRYTYRHILSVGPPVVVNALQLLFETPLDDPGLRPGDSIPILFSNGIVSSLYGFNAQVGTLAHFLVSGRLIVQSVPEPSTVLLIAAGVIVISLTIQRRSG
jgi:hypothetical protein